MRAVTPQPEPDDFDHRVREPGNAGLARRRRNGQRLWFNPLWSLVYDEFHSLYGGFCAYTCFYQLDRATVDHFKPKCRYPNLAYEWHNYRLSSPRANQFKGSREDILDPFEIGDGWFVLDLPSCLIRVRDGLEDTLADAVTCTIDALRLNDDDYLVQRRSDLVYAFVQGDVSRTYIQRMNPFIFDEITRQGLWPHVGRLFRRR